MTVDGGRRLFQVGDAELQRGDRSTTTESEELRRLRKENAERQRADEILKAASAFSRRNSTRPGGRLGAPEHGRGLLVVNRLSVSWGHRRDGDRRTVRAQVRLA